ncbi:unnamed protein product [Alopecurus aequalis]
MAGSEQRVVAVIMVGGPTKGTRFRPLSLNVPKPLFPLAGQPMVHHPISACRRIPNLAQIYLIGFYEEREFALYVSSISNELRIPVRYLREDKPHGSAGGLYSFRDYIMEDSPVSDLINCGVYIFTPNIFNAIEDVLKQKKDRATIRRVSSFEALQSATKALPADYVRLDQDILSPLAGKKELYTYQTLDFWEQIKTPGMSLRCSGLYLSQFRHTSPHLLASGDGKKSATIIGDVYIHPSAKVHPTAKIGPNVSLSANARIGAGARLINCIILDDVEIMDNAVVIHSIVGWKSTIGKWSRVQGEGDHNAKLGITILGEAVDVEDEVVVTNSIVLPNKTLNVSVQEEIIL